jgi:CelD/BcsL family acetyltransferase involved in cellulose biosynthesis
MELLSSDQRDRAAAAWAQHETAETPLACSWAWTQTWLEHYGDVVPHRFAVGEDGVALLTYGTARSSGIKLRTVHLGTAAEPAGESVYVQRNALLGTEAFATHLLETLGGQRDFDELRIDGFAVPLPGLDELEPQDSPIVDLSEAQGDVLPLLSSNTRYQVRRSLRGYGEVETEWAETVPRALEIFEEMRELHEARWRAVGEPGAFASERQLAFHRTLIERHLPRVMLFRVSSAEGTIGCLYSHLEQRSALSYQLGVIPSTDNKLKPGFVAHALGMQACHDRGIEIYDFLSGGLEYKRELARGKRELYWGRGLRRGPRARIANLLRRVRT